MLEKLSIKNFQCHEDLELELDPLVTVLCGDSDHGKTAIIRALKWLCFNRPSGLQFARHGADAVRVALSMDGLELCRDRSSSENNYQLDKHVYQAFGLEVPEPISRVLNLDPKLNFQGQHDPPFWFFLTPGEVSKELNSVVNLGLIDSTLANISSGLRSAKVAVEITEERLNKALKEQKDLEWVMDANRSLEELENLEKWLIYKRARIDGLALLIDRARITNRKRKDSLQAKQEAANVLLLGEGAVRLKSRVERLETLLESIREHEQIVSKQVPRDTIQKFQEIHDSLVKKNGEVNRLKNLVDQIKKYEEILCQERKMSSEAELELKETMKVCPLCGQET